MCSKYRDHPGSTAVRLFESNERRMLKNFAKACRLDWQRFKRIYKWIEEAINDLLGTQTLLAYCSSRRNMGRSECKYAEDTYIITSPIDPTLDELLDVVDENEHLHDDFALVWCNTRRYMQIVQHMIEHAQVQMFTRYGPLKRTQDKMLESMGRARNRARSMPNLDSTLLSTFRTSDDLMSDDSEAEVDEKREEKVEELRKAITRKISSNTRPIEEIINENMRRRIVQFNIDQVRRKDSGML